MASRLVAAAAAASSSSLARLISRRGLASSAGRRWTAKKVNLWEDPTSPMRWKDSHFVIASVSIWGGCMYIIFSSPWKKENHKKAARERKHRSKLHTAAAEFDLLTRRCNCVQ